MDRGSAYTVEGGLIVHLIPKNAHSQQVSSLYRSKKEAVKVTDQFPNYKRFMVVRHPLDRIVSAYGFFMLKDPTSKLHQFMRNLGYKKPMEFSSFLDHYLQKYDQNDHTAKQIDFTGGNEIDFLVPIEKLSEVWEKEIVPNYKVKPFQEVHRNSSPRKKDYESYFTDEQKARVLEVFKDDLELYMKAQEKYKWLTL